MRKHGLAVFVALFLLPGSVAQALPVNPLTGGSGLGFWAGWETLIDFDDTLGAPYDTSLDITPGFASLYDVYVSDMYIVGDAFGLIVDSVPMDWRASSWIGSGGGEGRLFHAYYFDLLLDAGPHQIQFDVRAVFSPGQMYWEVSRVPGPVPEPASLLLFGTGLVGLRAWRKRGQ